MCAHNSEVLSLFSLQKLDFRSLFFLARPNRMRPNLLMRGTWPHNPLLCWIKPGKNLIRPLLLISNQPAWIAAEYILITRNHRGCEAASEAWHTVMHEQYSRLNCAVRGRRLSERQQRHSGTRAASSHAHIQSNYREDEAWALRSRWPCCRTDWWGAVSPQRIK